MFSLSVQRTSNVINTILSHKCNHTRVIFLRLYKKSSYRNLINHVWDKKTLNTLQKFPKKYKHYVSYREHNTENFKKKEEDIINLEQPVLEHKILHSMLEESVHYKDTIMPPIKTKVEVSYQEICQLYIVDWSNEPVSNIYDAIKKISYCHLNGSCFEISMYDNILLPLGEKFNSLGDKQLMILMQHLIALTDEVQKSNNWQSFLKKLNKECLKRFFPSTIENMLLLADIFYQLEDIESYYMWRALRKIGSKCTKLSPKHMVQLFFLITVVKSNCDLNMYEAECKLQECIHELSGNELGIFARGFFLNKKSIRNKILLAEIIRKVQQNIQSMDSTAIASIMKLIRYSDCYHCLVEFQDLLKCLHTEIPRLSFICLTHIAHALGGHRVYDETLIKIILERVINEMKSARLKDIERILFTIYAVAPQTDYYQEIVKKLLNEIVLNYQTNRLDEINRYAISLVRILSYVSAKSIYVPQLIQHVFQPSFVQKTYKNNMRLLTNDLLVLQCTIQIEFPYYQGQLLSEQLYSYLVKKYTPSDDIQRKDNNIKLRSEIVFLCKNNLGLDVYVDYILPHYSVRDIIFGLDEHNNPVDVEPILSSMPFGTLKYVNSDELKKIKWNVLCLLPLRAKVIGHSSYTGPTCRKMKELKTLGYTVLPIQEAGWYLLNEEKRKEDYLRQLIYGKRSENFIDEINFLNYNTK